MFQVELSAAVRNATGKGPMRQLRTTGMTPAVVYGGGGEAMNLQLETKTLTAKLLDFSRRNTVVTLKMENGTEKSVAIGEIQTDPITDKLIHVDFCEIDLEKKRKYSVPVIYNGTSKGVDLGGDLIVNFHKVVLEGKPLDIPDECVVDVTPLGMGDSLKCGEIAIPASVKMVTDTEAVAVSVVKPGQKAA